MSEDESATFEQRFVAVEEVLEVGVLVLELGGLEAGADFAEVAAQVCEVVVRRG